jgi:hypothetical protein
MLITQVSDGPYLYSLADIFPQPMLDMIQQRSWAEEPYTRLSIGHGLRREIQFNPAIDSELDQYCRTHVVQAIESACGIEFTCLEQYHYAWWLDEPGFRPQRHSDGDKPSAVQIYSCDQPDLGTTFYHNPTGAQTVHRFPGYQNTGYLMLNQPCEQRPTLWHDMEQAVPPGVLRVCLYLGFGPYCKT